MQPMADSRSLHARLTAYQRAQLRPGVVADFDASIRDELAMRRIGDAFVERERERIASLASEAPASPGPFVEWFEHLRETGPGQGDPLFPWLEERATFGEMRWFLAQEVSGEAGFEDLVALTQLKLPTRVKLEMARNYWDEMGCGHESGMHGPLLDKLAQHFDVARDPPATCWESLALGNLMIALATDRRRTWQSVGALGVIELTAPGRAEYVNRALKRLGVPGEARRYFALHATLDVKHSRSWNDEVIAPLVSEFPEAARGIAEGALMRLEAGARCFRRYRDELWANRRSP